MPKKEGNFNSTVVSKTVNDSGSCGQVTNVIVHGTGSGEAGPQGERGERGPPGPRGERGERGPPGQGETIFSIEASVL